MDLRSFCIVLILAVLIVAYPSDTALMFDGNAVAGSVRAVVKHEGRDIYVPLDGVTVTVVQNTSISNLSRENDGVYVLYIPSDSYRTFDLLYTKRGYCSDKRRGITNGERHKKIDVVTMIPEREVASLSDSEKQELLNVAAEILEMSKEADTPAVKVQLRDAAMRNITVLQQSIDPTIPAAIARPNPALKQRIDNLLGSGD